MTRCAAAAAIEPCLEHGPARLEYAIPVKTVPAAAASCRSRVLLESAVFAATAHHAMIELNPIRQRIDDLRGRLDSLRGYL